LSYLSLQPVYRHSIANDNDLLKSICSSAKDAVRYGDARTLFPARDAEKNKESAKSSYELDKLLDPKTITGSEEAPDTAMQLGIASLLANIMSYPITKSKEEQQMDKLRRMANARNAEGTDEKDQFLALDAIEERVRRVISVRGIEALVSIAMSKPHSATGDDVSIANPSTSVRQAVAEALLHATTRQDKRQRGFIIQQGGAKALVALANSTVAQALRTQGMESGNSSQLSFTAIQALSHLLITENPALVSTDPIEVVPSLALLYLHADSSRLQRFEASLALTNVASLSPQLANRIAHAGFAKSILDTNATDAFVGADRGKESKGRLDIGAVLRERIFMEDNELSRRASLELLCNLLVVDDVFQRWSGETDDENQIKSSVKKDEKEKDKDINKSRTARDLTFLIALCAPAGIDEISKESGLKLRLAAGGAIATLCSSASACARILSLEPRIMNKIAKLIDPTIEIKQIDQIAEITDDDKDDPEEDTRLHKQDIESDPLGAEHGQWQLALRGLSCIECVLQYVDWIRGQGANDATAYKRAIIASGLVEAVKLIAKSGAKAIKENNQSQTIKSLQMQVTKQALELLKIAQHLGLFDN
jgi:protein unc-45